MSSSQNPFSHASRNSTTAHGRTSSPRGAPFHRGPWAESPADMMDQPFTDEMRDLQARGKDPYAGDASDGSDLSPERMPGGGGRMAAHHHHHHPHHHHHHHAQHHSHHHHRAPPSSRQPKEAFTKTERRDWAETVLDNPELLMMYAQSSGATVPATRFRFKKIMCGLDDDEDDDDDDDEPIPETGGYQHLQQHQQKYHGQGGQSLRMSAAQQQQQQRGRGEGGSRSGRR
ncbi:hypothetical protein KVR01_005966 [Diaporthe batatas]|uniref:uncharacterized protein n=1 Tax=Diaporthe batatas TaxID=748121 RepID=UPI001D04E53F|nr:uncharacterized protein KVR01_005966 [Diaporthe batatas]KAG8164048.1 hypothetical protein KVR01_005966 [Diaporthe batatas]